MTGFCRAALCVVAVLTCFAPGDAHAHAASQALGDFYGGLLHPLTDVVHLLPFIALGLLAGQRGSQVNSLLLIFPGALMAGAALALLMPPLPGLELLNIASALLFGALVAAAAPLPAAALYALAAFFGLTHGLANGTAIDAFVRPLLFIPGLGLAGLLVLAWGAQIVEYLVARRTPWMQIAVRVAGSWIAAIALLVLGLSARKLLAG